MFLDEVIQHPAQPHLESLQQWHLRHIPGEIVLVADCFHCKKGLSNVKMNMKNCSPWEEPTSEHFLKDPMAEQKNSVSRKKQQRGSAMN